MWADIGPRRDSGRSSSLLSYRTGCHPQGERAVAALECPRCGNPATAKKTVLHCSDTQCRPTCGFAGCGRSFNSERSVSNHARRAHAEWYHRVITEQNELVGPKKSTVWNDAEILEVVLDTLELEDRVRTKKALDTELASRRPGRSVSSLTQLRTKHMTPAGSLYRRLLSEQRSLRDESAQLHTSDQEGTVTAGALGRAAEEDDVSNNSVQDQENTQLQIAIDFEILEKRSGMPVTRDVINSKLSEGKVQEFLDELLEHLYPAKAQRNKSRANRRKTPALKSRRMRRVQEYAETQHAYTKRQIGRASCRERV